MKYSISSLISLILISMASRIAAQTSVDMDSVRSEYFKILTQYALELESNTVWLSYIETLQPTTGTLLQSFMARFSTFSDEDEITQLYTEYPSSEYYEYWTQFYPYSMLALVTGESNAVGSETTTTVGSQFTNTDTPASASLSILSSTTTSSTLPLITSSPSRSAAPTLSSSPSAILSTTPSPALGSTSRSTLSSTLSSIVSSIPSSISSSTLSSASSSTSRSALNSTSSSASSPASSIEPSNNAATVLPYTVIGLSALAAGIMLL